MTARALSLIALSLVVGPACSSSSSSTGDAGTGTGTDTGSAADTAPNDVGGGGDAAPATDTGGGTSDADDTGTTVPDAGPSKCAKVTCSGAYQKCCPATGACYDTRTGTCY